MAKLVFPFKIRYLLIFLIFSVWIMAGGLIYAQEAVREEAQKKAEEIHEIASSDVIYHNEELKALYYQNIQIIELLKDIRGLLQAQAEKVE